MQHKNHWLIICLCFMPLLLWAAGQNDSNINHRNISPMISPNISHLHVYDFCQDSLGYIWIATARGLNCYNGYEFKQFFHNKNNDASLDNDMIYSLFLDSRNELWVGTSTGINKYDFMSSRFSHYTMQDASVHTFYEDKQGQLWVGTNIGIGIIDTENKTMEICSDTAVTIREVSSILEDSHGRLWAGTSNGLYCRNWNMQWESVQLPNKARVTCICADPQGVFMIGTSVGIVFFDPKTGKFIDQPHMLAAQTSLQTGYIHFIREIAPLKYLIGTSYSGLFLYDALRQTLEHNPVDYMVNSPQLTCCNVDNQGNTWIGSFDKGFSIFNTHHHFFNRDTKLNDTFKGISTTRIVEDKYGNLWIGTRYSGLCHYGKEGITKIYDSDNSPLFSGNNNLIEELYIDSHERLWLVCTNQIFCCTFDRSGNITGIVRQIKLEKATGTASITEDHEGNIWFGLSIGLFVIKDDYMKGTFERIYKNNIPKVYRLSNGELLFSAYGKGICRINKDFTISEVKMPNPEANIISRFCVEIFEDMQKGCWFGSYNEGAMYMKENECRIFSMADGLPCNDIVCIQGDRSGNIWMGTAYGLSRLDTEFSITNYFEYDGTQGDQYHEKATLLRSDGILFFAGAHGLTFFNPQLIVPNSYPPPIVIEDLKIHNESVLPGEKGSVLERQVAFTQKITLNHNHSLITIDYSGIDFMSSQKLTYAYKLEGFDHQWNQVGNHRRATYSNLTPGRYKFVVTAFNNDGMQSTLPATLDIIVKPAPWATWWAWLLYFTAFCAATGLFMRLWMKIKHQQQSLIIEANEREREHEMTEMKMTFFTNISHELRTPLTLISAPVQQLEECVDPDSKEGRLIHIIFRNRNRLHRLIDQLLDFRKMEAGMIALKVQYGDIMEKLISIIDFYDAPASEKGIAVRFTPHIGNMEIWYDADKIEKIMHNLLSNALKHTPNGGEIRVTTREVLCADISNRYKELSLSDDNYLEISVLDDGPGVPSDKLNELFVRYRQIKSSKGMKPDYAGTGIGLHYTKQLAEVHHGGITGNLRPEGGMLFSFLLPLNDVYALEEKTSATNETEFSGEQTFITCQEEYMDSEEKEVENETNAGSFAYTVLIAEDNMELIAYFKQMLGDKYNLLEAQDGLQAWNIMQEKCPDLVLSDVVMPELSGYELCSRIKQHPVFSHVPVILLTARTSMSDQIEGLSYGADAYICKPFNVDYLLLTIENRLNSREKLRIYYSTPRASTAIVEKEEMPVKLNTLDQAFMDKLMQLLEKDLAKPEMNIEAIAKEMAFSRSSFYRKIKGLTNISPADLIRNYRLKRAAEMILEGSWSLYEVSERTGFGNYSHFSVLFKKHFGTSPQSYKAESKAKFSHP